MFKQRRALTFWAVVSLGAQVASYTIGRGGTGGGGIAVESSCAESHWCGKGPVGAVHARVTRNRSRSAFRAIVSRHAGSSTAGGWTLTRQQPGIIADNCWCGGPRAEAAEVARIALASWL